MNFPTKCRENPFFIVLKCPFTCSIDETFWGRLFWKIHFWTFFLSNFQNPKYFMPKCIVRP